MNDLTGQRVKVMAGPAAGHVGVVTAHASIPTKAGPFEQIRIAFAPPIHVAAAGFLDAVWRAPSEIRICLEPARAA
jgi:hypothetical protein